MQADGATIAEDGTVTASLHNVTDFKEFSSDPAEQTGHYFAAKLTGTGQKMTLKKNGVERPDKKDLPFDPDLVIRVESTSDTLDITVDGEALPQLKFTGCTLEE